jgi:molybdopterin synthase catalytic subunit
MRIRLVAFATAADALGTGERELTLAPGSTVADLRRTLEAEYPALAPIWPRLAVAVDGELAAAGTALADGAEVALLPPVSGGAPDPPPVALSDEPLDVAAITAAVTRPGHGAVLVFLGTVRDHDQGRPVVQLTYSAYRPMAERRLAAIVQELAEEYPGLQIALVHRLGVVPAGEPSVVIAVSSPHREAAYGASRRALERLKAEVPIWKREHFAGGETRWREEEPLVPAAAAEPVGPR